MTEHLNPAFSLLMVDDEEAWLRSLQMTLGLAGGITNIVRCSDSRQVMGILEQGSIGLILLDLNMPHISGEQLLPQLVERYPEIPVIVISGLNQVERAVKCMKLGAFDFFIKTVEEDRLLQGIQRAIELIELRHENRELRSRVLDDKLDHPGAFSSIVARSKEMRAVFQYCESVVHSSQPILITGESGVGKELVAKAIYRLCSPRGKMVTVNVAGLDDNVFSDTLFGHTRGAFTGAESARGGMVEQAEEGILFLDEIGDLSLSSQVKLLRLLQEGEYFQLGSDLPKRINARVVLATNQDLTQKLACGEFRKDLYYRLCAHNIHIPALRERREDIPLLLDFFLEEAAEQMGKKIPSYPRELPVLLANHPFPGNIREIKAMVYDAMTRHKNKMLSMETFKKAMGRHPDHQTAEEPGQSASAGIFNDNAPLPPLNKISDLLVMEAMNRAEGNQTLAAHLLSVTQSALSRRLKKIREPA